LHGRARHLFPPEQFITGMPAVRRAGIHAYARNIMSQSKSILLSAACLLAMTPSLAFACACGCGVFEVGTGTMMPTGPGGTVWLEYDFMNQSQNWSGTSRAPSANNPDKQIRTDFLTAGMQYMFNRQWGVEAEVPYWDRHFKTTTDFPAMGNTQTFERAALGDVRVRGVYSGFSDDMSTGVTFGLKLATGDFTYPHLDRDTSIGTGSTDLLLGAYHMGDLTGDNLFDWFVNGQWEHAFITQDHYRPGDEWDAATGVYYNGIDMGKGGKLAPLLQLIGSYRNHDIGMRSNSSDSGYSRLLISPGMEYDVNAVRLYGDVEFPIYQSVNGNQLTAPVLFKFIVGYSF
jgi:hypothetical protein